MQAKRDGSQDQIEILNWNVKFIKIQKFYQDTKTIISKVQLHCDIYKKHVTWVGADASCGSITFLFTNYVFQFFSMLSYSYDFFYFDFICLD